MRYAGYACFNVSINHLDDLSLAGIDQHDLLADRKIPVHGVARASIRCFMPGSMM